MTPVELRDPTDLDLDAVAAAVRQQGAVTVGPTAETPPGERDALQSWLARRRAVADAQLFIALRDGVVLGTAALVPYQGEREVAFRLAPDDSDAILTVVEQLIALEPVRPLFARAAPAAAAAMQILERAGFTRFTAPDAPADEEIVYALLPVADGY